MIIFSCLDSVVFRKLFFDSAKRERKCADAIGSVQVPWAGHFQCENIIYFSNKIYGINFIK